MQAKAGFDYQDTVTLLVLIEHFKLHGDSARVRPEGSDDLVLSWIEGASEQRTCVQVKKPRTDKLGTPKPAPWSLSEVAKHLVQEALGRLSGPASVHTRQIFILGDYIDTEVRELLASDAAKQWSAAYLGLLHLLAKDRSGISEGWSTKDQTALTQWRPPLVQQAQGRVELWKIWEEKFRQFLMERHLNPPKLADYLREVETLDQLLSEALTRIEIRESYGSEQVLTDRACKALQEYFGLSAPVVRDTLFRSLRGFISDIAKVPERWIDRQVLELELLRTWPEMVLVREPPNLDRTYISRPAVIQKLSDALHGPALEVIGISGSGKTGLAVEWLRDILQRSPGCWAMYCQVRPSHSLRDILAGLAFRLRGYGFAVPFEIITRSQQSDENSINTIAGSFTALPKQTTLLIDLVEGRGNEGLYQDLARLIPQLAGGRLRLAVFAQERVFTHISALKKQLSGIEEFDPPGLQFEEFVELVKRLQPDQGIDRALCYSIFEKASAQRTSGILPGVADTLARVPKAAMLTLQSSPLPALVAQAERQRFDRIQRRAAAEKLLCFILPFRPIDAQQIFPADPINSAIEEMRSLGFLRPHDAEHLEMHEAVRMRLEEVLTPDLLKETHKHLALYYQGQGQLIAAIAHLEKAGETNAARSLAREVYFRGQQQWELRDYIRDHRVLSADEIAQRLITDGDSICLDLLRGGTYPSVAPVLLHAIYRHPERFETEYRWAWNMTEGVLVSDAKFLYELIVFFLRRSEGTAAQTSAIDWISHGALRAGARVDEQTLELFNKSDPEQKAKLVQFLLQDPRRDILKIAFEFLQSHQRIFQSHQRVFAQSQAGSREPRLRLHEDKDVIELLAALPRIKEQLLIAEQSVQFGVLSDFIWKERRFLQPVCRRLLANIAEQDEAILISAMRVLLFLGDPEARRLSEAFLLHHQGRGFLQTLAVVSMAFHPRTGDLERLNQLLITPDLNIDIETRIGIAQVLISRGESPYKTLTKLASGDPQYEKGYRFWCLMIAMLYPFPEAVALLEAELSEIKDENKVHIFAAIYVKLAELPGQEITEALIRALESPWALVRLTALAGLKNRRVRCAAEPIAKLLDKEQEPEVVRLGLLAEVASGPTGLNRMQSLWERVPGSEYWRCVMIGRLRAIEEAHVLVTIALDSTKPWETRRAAILSAGRLPYEAALIHIVKPIIHDSILCLRDSSSLLGHSLLCNLLGKPARDVWDTLQRGQDSFVFIWSGVYDNWKKHQMSAWGAEPTGTEAALWLYKSLTELGAPTRTEARRLVLNKLHLPILQSAVLRALYLADRPDIIETIALETREEYLLIRALVVHRKHHLADKGLASRVRADYEHRDQPLSLRLSRIIERLSADGSIAPIPALHSNPEVDKPSNTVPNHRLKHADVINALSSGQLPTGDLVLIVDNEIEFIELVELLDPKNDERLEYRPVQPRPFLRSDGMAVHGVKAIRIDQHSTIRKRLRPLLAAANQLSLEIPWHRPLLVIFPQPNDYIKEYLKVILQQNQRTVFVADLNNNGDLLLSAYLHPELHSFMQPLLNEDWIPALLRFSSIGSTELLHAVCSAARSINSPTIDVVLRSAFRRWLSWFDKQEENYQHSENWPLWHAFDALTKHSRFKQIPGFEQRLSEICSLNLEWHIKQDLLACICQDPGGYIFIEQQLMRATSFDIYEYDEVDKLDDAADSLFRRLDET